MPKNNPIVWMMKLLFGRVLSMLQYRTFPDSSWYTIINGAHNNLPFKLSALSNKKNDNKISACVKIKSLKLQRLELSNKSEN